MNSLLHKIIDKGKGRRFYRFGNADGKFWVVPAENMRVALNLYQPSGIKGNMVKTLFPLLHRLPFVRKAIKAEIFCCTLQEELCELLCKIFGVKDIEFAIFEGTPCVHQKITMQLSCGKKILGYCKVSSNDAVSALFEREKNTLCRLHEKGVKNIPQALYCGTMSNGAHIFVQSTKKTSHSKVVHKWGALQEDFLFNLHQKTKQEILFEESDFYRSLVALQKNIDWLPCNTDKNLIVSIIDETIKKHCGERVEYSAFHADFTPWNMFKEKGELFVFDFEYAAATYPQGLDRCHFLMQTAIFEKHISKENIGQTIASLPAKEKEIFKMYLLDVISRFTRREGKKVTGNAAHPFEAWNYLLRSF